LWGELTGGCSSFSGAPPSGLADKFENTPSDCIPPPTILPPGADAFACVRCSFRSTDDACVVGDVGVLTSRLLSSDSSSLSSPSASNASARSGSTISFLRLEDTEEARDRKDGGGESGVGWDRGGCSNVGVVRLSSCVLTCESPNVSSESPVGLSTSSGRTGSYRPAIAASR
jgi:hypothetical protein